MCKTKASRLKELLDVVEVPLFFVVKQGDVFKFNLDKEKLYIIRSSSSKEDQNKFSQAGQFLTIGPVKHNKVVCAVEKLLGQQDCEEAIVQEFISAGERGVAFCFEENDIFVEYSNIAEGVTSGKIKPFVAVLPTEISRYKKLQSEIIKIFQKFGPADIEFIGIENPKFVQVRPITKKFKFDRKLETLKMKIQEIKVSAWTENDLCKIIPERESVAADFLEKYFEAIKFIFNHEFGRKISKGNNSIIKISNQYFMSEEFSERIMPTRWDLLKFSFRFHNIFKKIKKEIDDHDTLKLVVNSILLSYGYDLFKTQEILLLREKYQKKINANLKEGKIKKYACISKKLASRLKLDFHQKSWREIEYYNGEGITVVNGDFSGYPLFRIKNVKKNIPDNVIVVTNELYPEIGKNIKKIKGIICKNGSLNSHIAILAREYEVPLKIQAPIENL